MPFANTCTREKSDEAYERLQIPAGYELTA
jgi:hypothetical protein